MVRILLALALVGCGSSSGAPPAVDAATAGDPVDAAASTGDAAAGGDASAPTTVMKFCNPIYAAGGTPLSLTFAVGQPPVAFTATSGNCSPVAPSPCRVVPTGARVPGVLLDSGGKQLASGSLNLLANTEYIFFAAIDGTGTTLTVSGGVVSPGFQCATVDPFHRDGGAAADATTD